MTWSSMLMYNLHVCQLQNLVLDQQPMSVVGEHCKQVQTSYTDANNGICKYNTKNIFCFLNNSGGSTPAELQFVDVPILSDSVCQQAYGNIPTNLQVCAGVSQGGKDSCQGDSGGPLVQFANGRAEIVGIVSYGIGCAQAEYPGVYTRITPYVSWINSITGGCEGMGITVFKF